MLWQMGDYRLRLRRTLRTSCASCFGMRMVPGFASTRAASSSNFLASSPKSVGMLRIGLAIIFSLWSTCVICWSRSLERKGTAFLVNMQILGRESVENLYFAMWNVDIWGVFGGDFWYLSTNLVKFWVPLSGASDEASGSGMFLLFTSPHWWHWELHPWFLCIARGWCLRRLQISVGFRGRWRHSS